VFLGGVHVGDEQRDQEKDEADSSERAEAGKEESRGAEEFEDASDVNEEQRLREKRGNHAGEVVAHFVEVGRGGEDEHDGEGITSRVVPRGERSNAQSANSTQEEPSDEHHNQHNHVVWDHPTGGGGKLENGKRNCKPQVPLRPSQNASGLARNDTGCWLERA
jgi:hypothetical protein